MRFELDEKEMPKDPGRMFADPVHQYLYEELTKVKEIVELIKDQLRRDTGKLYGQQKGDKNVIQNPN